MTLKDELKNTLSKKEKVILSQSTNPPQTDNFVNKIQQEKYNKSLNNLFLKIQKSLKDTLAITSNDKIASNNYRLSSVVSISSKNYITIKSDNTWNTTNKFNYVQVTNIEKGIFFLSTEFAFYLTKDADYLIEDIRSLCEKEEIIIEPIIRVYEMDYDEWKYNGIYKPGDKIKKGKSYSTELLLKCTIQLL